MSWSYSQATGILGSADGLFTARGYAGSADGRNNPTAQNIVDIGPLPQGRYSFGQIFECTQVLANDGICGDCHGTGKHKHGPSVIRLVPDPNNEMFGRAGFLIHGDNATGTASEGCIVLALATRQQLMDSNDYVIEVTA